MNSIKVNIYCLADPFTLKIRYIGRTKNSLKKRLTEHISKAKYYETYNSNVTPTHAVNWIKSLLKKNSTPLIKKLTIVEGWKKSYIVEQNLISKYCKKHNLTNYRDRGEGGINQKISQEQRDRISNTLKIYYKTNINACKGTPVYVYNLKGIFIKKFETNNLAAKELDLNRFSVSKCKNGNRKQYKGYQFSKKKENMPDLSKNNHVLAALRRNS